MDEQLITLLETRGLPCYKQGSLTNEDTYPLSFFTFFLTSADEEYYDNEPTICKYQYIIYYYTNDITTLDEEIRQTRKLLRDNEIQTSMPVDALSDEDTHIGKMFFAYATK